MSSKISSEVREMEDHLKYRLVIVYEKVMMKFIRRHELR